MTPEQADAINEQASLARIARWTKTRNIGTPDDWSASAECARMLAHIMVRFATALGGDLTDPAVRGDLRTLRALCDLLLAAGDEQRATEAAKKQTTKKKRTA